LLIRDNWDKFQVFARASPHQKVLVASNLKRMGKKILMCGDGVNDVAAMKIADCGVALLNGFGNQKASSTSNNDLENERRLRKIRTKSLGSNRRKRRRKQQNDVLSSRKAIVNQKIQQAIRNVKVEAAKQQGIKDPEDPKLQLTGWEVKETFRQIMKINREEKARRFLLHKGGAGAAKILAQDDKLLRGEQNDDDALQPIDEEEDEDDDIQLGEASLVSSFSCLRPAIDGVESILRYGLAAAAYLQVTHDRIAQGCITHAFQFLINYGHRIRYGQTMGYVEMACSTFHSELSNRASYAPRPTLTAQSLPGSIWNVGGVASTILQSAWHVVSYQRSFALAKGLESQFVLPDPRKRMIQTRPDDPLASVLPVFHYLRNALVEAPVTLPGDRPMSAITKLFWPKPFRPNYLTNVYLLHSIWTSAIITFTNHAGWPFYHRILENRILLVATAIPIFLVFNLIAEGTPQLNQWLELRPMPTSRSRIVLLAIFLADLVGCCLVSFFCNKYRWRNGAAAVTNEEEPDNDDDNDDSWASTEEEKLLKEEAEENKSLVKIFISSMAMIVVNLITKELQELPSP